jgi:hypothetical protein
VFWAPRIFAASGFVRHAHASGYYPILASELWSFRDESIGAGSRLKMMGIVEMAGGMEGDGLERAWKLPASQSITRSGLARDCMKAWLLEH